MSPRCSRSTLSAAVVAMVAMFVSSGCDGHPAAQAASQTNVDPQSRTTVRSNSAAASMSESAAQLSISSSPAAVSRPSATRDTDSFTTTGPLVAVQQADVAAARDGRVVQIAVEIGDHVQRGQLLALLDNRALLSASDAQKARVASLQAEVRDWQAEQKSVELDLHRADQLRADKIISQESWEHVKYKLDETIAEGARYRANEAEAEDDLNAANLQLEQSRVVAPFAGVVGRSSLRIAQQVKQGDVLFWITAVSPLRILFTVPESAMAAFHAGARLELTTLDYPGLRQVAHILRVSPVVDPTSGSVQIIGAVVHPSPLLKPGMSMQVRLAP